MQVKKVELNGFNRLHFFLFLLNIQHTTLPSNQRGQLREAQLPKCGSLSFKKDSYLNLWFRELACRLGNQTRLQPVTGLNCIVMIHSIENPSFHVLPLINKASRNCNAYSLQKKLWSEQISCGPLSNTLSASKFQPTYLFALFSTVDIALCTL